MKLNAWIQKIWISNVLIVFFSGGTSLNSHNDWAIFLIDILNVIPLNRTRCCSINISEKLFKLHYHLNVLKDEKKWDEKSWEPKRERERERKQTFYGIKKYNIKMLI